MSTSAFAPVVPSIVPAALAVAVGVFFGVVAVVGIFVIVVVANRAEPDPTGRRPLAVYYFAVSFLTLFAALFGSFGIVLGLVQLIGGHGGAVAGVGSAAPAVSGLPALPGIPEPVAAGVLHPVGDAVARTAVVSGIVLVVAAAVLFVHLRRGLAVSGRADPRLGPVGRVGQTYIAATAFTALVIAVVSVVVTSYELARIVAPGVFEVPGPRVDTLRPLLAAAYLALAALAVLLTHLRLVPGEVRRVSWSTVRLVQGPDDEPGIGGAVGGPGPGTPGPGGPGMAPPAARPPAPTAAPAPAPPSTSPSSPPLSPPAPTPPLPPTSLMPPLLPPTDPTDP
jgi:hypothetical protein